MNRKLYVGNLSYSVTKEELEQFFSAAGKVDSVTIVTDRYSGQPRGFAFVEMSTPDEAQEAKNKLSGQTLGNRQIIINEARLEVPRPNRRFDGKGRKRF